MASSLADGQGYAYMGFPHNKYPPGLPVLLAAVELVTAGGVMLMRGLMALSGARAGRHLQAKDKTQKHSSPD